MDACFSGNTRLNIQKDTSNTPRSLAAGRALPRTHLAVAGEGGVVKQKVGTKEEDDGVKYAQACPIHEDRPAEEGVLCYVPDVRTHEETSVTSPTRCPKYKLLLLEGLILPI